MNNVKKQNAKKILFSNKVTKPIAKFVVNIYHFFRKISLSIKSNFFRNHYFGNKHLKINKINLIQYKAKNIGDVLSPLVCNFLLKEKGLTLNSKTLKKYSVLSAIGSVLSYYTCDRVVWGSGFISNNTFFGKKIKHKMNFDVRCIRGPLSLEKLKSDNINFTTKKIVYGDPALLMPLFYHPTTNDKKYNVSIILHIKDKNNFPNNYNCIDVETEDYKKFIDDIVSSKLIVSSSLHGIILAEAYGIPAIWLKASQDEFKYLDYYYSTKRYDIKFIKNIDEIDSFIPMTLPNFKIMQKNLIESFPYDLWLK